MAPTPDDGQLSLFLGLAGPRAEHEPPDDAAAEFPAEVPSGVRDDRQLDLFADQAVLARALDAAIAGGRFEDATRLRRSIDDCFSPEKAHRLAPLDRLAGEAWEGPPETPLALWAEIDRQLESQPWLRGRLRTGVFRRLLQSHAPAELVGARPECLPLLARFLESWPGRSPEEGRREARALVRDSLLAGRTLAPLDFREDRALAELLAEELSPRWLACLGRIRRLWPSSPPRESEWHALAESPVCPDDLRRQARRRMKQLHPDLHAHFMRHAPPE